MNGFLKTTLPAIRKASLAAWRAFRQLSQQSRPEEMNVWTRIVAVERNNVTVSFGDGAVGIS